ncbi:mediator of RNA polymerase II transcription subunit 21 [Thrips palmi]|uniref:Mediator of RNA polymerase II transcription subunit 21 n=1 Tax=Thrips palmi TaxID=161013 RepID=A0A6P8Y867_THRPL|nr:mediator of RNA polymerase II transcription subunit 21 [Thrips palmi]
MADRLTQLQDTINQQADNFCNSIGILQQFSTPSKFDRSGSQTPQQQQEVTDYAHLFATLIARCAKDIDVLIESLPNEDSSTELQVASLRQLEQESQKAGERLEEVVARGEVLLSQIQSALADIAQSQLDMQHSAPSHFPNGNIAVGQDIKNITTNSFSYVNSNSNPPEPQTGLGSGF